MMEESAMFIKVTLALRDIGVPAHAKGYRYLRTALLMAISDPNATAMVTKTLYPDVGKQYRETAVNVERMMRFAIGKAWQCADHDVLARYFGTVIAGRDTPPPISLFVATLSDTIKYDIH